MCTISPSIQGNSNVKFFHLCDLSYFIRWNYSIILLWQTILFESFYIISRREIIFQAAKNRAIVRVWFYLSSTLILY